jgi:predicted glycoside hydrolase/deacetylase ChbG (UPF0249 family)
MTSLRCAVLYFIGATLLLANAVAQQRPRMPQERLGYAANARLLIIHADDLGMNHSVNRATLQALENHWITSSSILVPCPWFPEVVRWARDHRDADLGIHLALTSEWNDFRWGPVAPSDKVRSLLDKDGYLYVDTPLLEHVSLPEVETELRAQIERARAAGIRITHLDTHMAALASTPELFAVYQKLGREYGLPVLSERAGAGFRVPAGVAIPEDQLFVEQVIQMEPGISAKDWLGWYEKTLSALPPGVYQLIVHLAYDDDEMRGATWDHPDWGAAWRQSDLDMVRSPEFRKFLHDQGFVLVTWSELAKLSTH